LFGDPTQDIEALAAEGLLGGAAAGALTGGGGSGTGGDAVMQGLRAAADMARTGVASAVAVPRVYLSGAGNAPRWGAGAAAGSYASAGGGGAASGGGASSGGYGGGGVIRRSAPASSAIAAAAPAAPITVSAAALPAHLQRSSVTGQATQYLGFLQVGSGGGAAPGSASSASAAAVAAAALDSGRLSPEAAEAAAAVAAALAGDAAKIGSAAGGVDAEGGGEDAAVWESLFAQLAETGNEGDAVATILEDGAADVPPPLPASGDGDAVPAAPMSLQASLASDDMSLGSLFRNEALLASVAAGDADTPPAADGGGAATASGDAGGEEEEWEDI